MQPNDDVVSIDAGRGEAGRDLYDGGGMPEKYVGALEPKLPIESSRGKWVPLNAPGRNVLLVSGPSPKTRRSISHSISRSWILEGLSRLNAKSV